MFFFQASWDPLHLLLVRPSIKKMVLINSMKPTLGAIASYVTSPFHYKYIALASRHPEYVHYSRPSWQSQATCRPWLNGLGACCAVYLFKMGFYKQHMIRSSHTFYHLLKQVFNCPMLCSAGDPHPPNKWGIQWCPQFIKNPLKSFF